jgi:hypothetical protein
MRLPRAIRFFRKPDHISFLVGFALLSSHLFIDDIFLKIATILTFSFTLAYELFEISKGGRDIYKLDHFTFVIGFVLLIVTIIYENQFILYLIFILMGFTLGYEVYRVRKMDLKNMNKNDK